MIITRTPLRISLVGGGTDFPSWSTKFGGLVVGGAISHFCYVTARYLPPFHDFKHRIIYRQVEEVDDVINIQHRSVRAVIQKMGWFDGRSGPGLEISHLADLPGRSGTGSSSAFAVGLLNALGGLQGKLMLPHELAQGAIEIEQKWLEETVGCQDQVFAAHGGLNVIRFRQDGEICLQPLPLNLDHVKELEANLMLFFTKQQRTSSEVAQSYAPTLVEKEKEQFAMMRLADLGINAILRKDWAKLGDLVDQSWRIKMGLSDKVTNAAINDLYVRARVAGAFGGKITGAGGGGCLILVVPPEKHHRVLDILAGDTVHIPFAFEATGSSIVFAEKKNLNAYRP